MKKVTSYNLKEGNVKRLAEKALLEGYSSTSMYLDKIMDKFLSDNGFLLTLSDESTYSLNSLMMNHDRTCSYLIERMVKKYCTSDAGAPKTKVARSKPKTYPGNIEEQFGFLWDAKGKKGAKPKALLKFKSMLAGDTDETCQTLTEMFIADIKKSASEPGFDTLHLTTYLNNERWIK